MRPDPSRGSPAGLPGQGDKEFEQLRLGFVTKESFIEEVDRLGDLGFKRITLKTGAYSMAELAMALRYGSEAKMGASSPWAAPRRDGDEPLADDE